MTATLEAPPEAPQADLSPLDGDGDDSLHFVCCDDNTALCGVALADAEEVDEIDENVCPNCMILAAVGAPCSVDCKA